MTSRRRTLISVFLVFHLFALALSAIPSSADLKAAVGVRESSDDRLSRPVRPTLDQLALVVRGATAALARLSPLTTPLVAGYVTRLGLNQTWNMFGNPPRGSEYVRFRYFWTRAAFRDGSVMLSTELIFPVAATGEGRLLRSYWESQRDKAVSNAVTAYFIERTRRGLSPGGTGSANGLDDALGRTFLPMVGYFTDRFARGKLAPGDRLVRTEVWYGWGESRPRGGKVAAPQSRADALEKYAIGISDERVSSLRFGAVGRSEREADIQWTVLYVQTP